MPINATGPSLQGSTTGLLPQHHETSTQPPNKFAEVPTEKKIPMARPQHGAPEPASTPIQRRYLTKSSWFPFKGSLIFKSRIPMPKEVASTIIPNKIPDDTAVLLIQNEHAALLMGGLESDIAVDPNEPFDYTEVDQEIQKLNDAIGLNNAECKQHKQTLLSLSGSVSDFDPVDIDPIRQKTTKALDDAESSILNLENQKEQLLDQKSKAETLHKTSQDNVFSWNPSNYLTPNRFIAAAATVPVVTKAASKVAVHASVGKATLPVLAITALSFAVSHALWGRNFRTPANNRFFSPIVSDGENSLHTHEGSFAIPMHGLNLELMREKARELKQNHKFELLNMNCSKSVIEIIKAGLSTEATKQTLPEGWGWSTPTDAEYLVNFLAEQGHIQLGYTDTDGEVLFPDENGDVWYNAREGKSEAEQSTIVKQESVISDDDISLRGETEEE